MVQWRGRPTSNRVEDRRGRGIPGGKATIGGGLGLLVILAVSLLTGSDPREVAEIVGGPSATVGAAAAGGRRAGPVRLGGPGGRGNRAETDRDLLETGDVEEGLRAAAAIGDDRLQRQTQGRVVPESFTHGTSAQRVRWFRRGLESGEPDACDSFAAGAV
jgi:predicted metalloprotease